MNKIGSYIFIISLFCCQTLMAKWTSKNQLPLDPTRKISFTTNEGTWMSLDISPDGRTIIFDLLGDLYTIPFRGGKAKQLTTGISYDAQPVYSPDGRMIAFVSDRGGSENLWVANFDGSNPKQLSKIENGKVCSPVFSNDGNYVYVSQEKSWGMITFEIWMYHIKGGSGVQITKAKPKDYVAKMDRPKLQRPNALGVTLSPDEKYIYYALKYGRWEYNAKLPLWQIARRDMETGQEDIITSAEGSGMKPKVSPDGTLLVYATRYKTKTGLRVKNLDSGSDDWLIYPVTRDDQESRATGGLLPTYEFTPSGTELVFSKDGKFFRINMVSKRLTEIKFEVDVNLSIGPELNFPYKVETGDVKSRIIMDPVLSPNGRKIAFSTLLHLYIANVDDGSYQRLTKSKLGEFHPSWSKDGRYLTYVTWESDGGHIWKVNANGKSSPKKLTKTSAFYSDPVFSPDGKKIIALKGSAIDRLRTHNEFSGPRIPMDLISIDTKDGQLKTIIPARGLGKPHFTNDPDRIYLNGFSYAETGKGPGLVSIRLDGTDKKEHLDVKGGDDSGWEEEPVHARDIRLSPNKKWALAVANNQLYLVAVPKLGGKAPIVNVNKPSVLVRKLTTVGADYFDWADNGQTITWAVGSTFYRLPFNSISFDSTVNALGEMILPDLNPIETKISVTVKRSNPNGVIAFTGGKIITMNGSEVIDDGLIIVKNNRISYVGKLSDNKDLGSAHIVDVSGKIIVPGFVDTHAHWIERRVGLLDRQNWSFIANVSWGVTTGLDVQTGTNDQFVYQDLIDAGVIIGPRAFSTGPGIFNSNNFKSKNEAVALMKRYRDHYRTKNLKSYSVGNRKQRHYVVQAAHELGMMPTTEGGLEMRLDMTHALDGFYGNEHNLPIMPIYKDVVELYAQSRIAYTPTMLVSYGGPWAEKYFYTTEEVHDDPKVQRFIPDNVIQKLTRRQPWFREDEYVFPKIAAGAAKIIRAGGRVGVGSHGQFQGLGYHWELWALHSGGLTELEALQAATIEGAKIIGVSDDIGSIEVGKLADLVILNKDPLESIRNTNSIEYVVKNGVLYQSDTMDEIWPNKTKLEPLWWWNDGPKQ